MANIIVNHSPKEINGQSSTQDQVIELLAKLKALLELGTACSLDNYTSKNLHSYLWVLSDLVEQMEEVMA